MVIAANRAAKHLVQGGPVGNRAVVMVFVTNKFVLVREGIRIRLTSVSCDCYFFLPYVLPCVAMCFHVLPCVAMCCHVVVVPV